MTREEHDLDHTFNFRQSRRVVRSKHTGRWILEEYNPVYDYWCTRRILSATRSKLTQPEATRELYALLTKTG